MSKKTCDHRTSALFNVSCSNYAQLEGFDK